MCRSLTRFELHSSCLVLQCDAPTEVGNATWNVTDYTIGAIATYSCFPGFQFPDNSTVDNATCLSSGDWTCVSDCTGEGFVIRDHESQT